MKLRACLFSINNNNERDEDRLPSVLAVDGIVESSHDLLTVLLYLSDILQRELTLPVIGVEVLLPLHH